MVGALAEGIVYTSHDTNLRTVESNQEMLYDLLTSKAITTEQFDRVKVFNRYSAPEGQEEPHDYGQDAVFTCPPYGKTELYSEAGAENLEEQEFNEWLTRLIKMSVGKNTRVIGIQITDDYEQAIADSGYPYEKVAIGKSSHHMTKNNKKRQEFIFEIDVTGSSL